MDINVAIIGLDTSHSIEFSRRMQGGDCPADQKVSGLRAVSCLRFPTPFQDEKGQDERQRQLEAWNVKVTTRFEEAVADCDAIMIEINDPAYHLEYFSRCVDLGKLIFLDKPMADTIANGKKIYDLIKSKNLKVFSSSSLRFVPQLVKACEEVPSPVYASIFGPLGGAPAGSGIVWYGVHTFEMLQRAMGRGAKSLFAYENADGVTAIVKYPGNRSAVAELRNDGWVYGGVLRMVETGTSYFVDMGRAYSDLLVEIEKFFRTGKSPVEIEDTLEVMAMLDATQKSVHSGKEETI
ncbi:MAG: Gfo/Idh/MocA family oxidoreductase [Phycisphaerae bacterium]|nr:Gfo/Idh/MocA family oxidoreductase [Phycisphaerae bacterium]